MRVIVIILLIIAAIFAFLKFSPGSQKKASPSTPSQTVAPAHAPAPPQAAAPDAAPQKAAKPTSTVTEEVNSVINYGIGATQLKAKQRATTKINEANQKHNQDIEEALK